MLKIYNIQADNRSIEVRLDEALLPKYCLAKDGINFDRRLLRHEFVEVHHQY